MPKLAPSTMIFINNTTLGEMTIKLTKLKELENAFHPNNIEEGNITTRFIHKDNFKPPTLNERFYIGGGYSTSAVQEILTENTFRTYNSIYLWEIIEDAPLEIVK
jgi:hypothetical protein